MWNLSFQLNFQYLLFKEIKKEKTEKAQSYPFSSKAILMNNFSLLWWNDNQKPNYSGILSTDFNSPVVTYCREMLQF